MNQTIPQNTGAFHLAFRAIDTMIHEQWVLVGAIFCLHFTFTVLEYGAPWVLHFPETLSTIFTVLLTIISYILGFFIPFAIIRKITLNARGEDADLRSIAEFSLHNWRKWMELSFWSIFYYLKYPILALFATGITYIIFGFVKNQYGLDVTIMLPYFNWGLIALAVIFIIWGLTRFPYLFAATYICIERDLDAKESVIASYELVQGHFWRTIWSFIVAGIIETFLISLPFNILLGIGIYVWYTHSGLSLNELIASFSTPKPEIPAALMPFSALISDMSSAILQVNTALFGFFLYKTYSAKTENPVESRSIWDK